MSMERRGALAGAGMTMQWLKAESNKTLAMLELAAHGTIDLTLDVPEIRDEPEFTCERFLRGFQYNRQVLEELEGYVMWRSNTKSRGGRHKGEPGPEGLPSAG